MLPSQCLSTILIWWYPDLISNIKENWNLLTHHKLFYNRNEKFIFNNIAIKLSITNTQSLGAILFLNYNYGRRVRTYTWSNGPWIQHLLNQLSNLILLAGSVPVGSNIYLWNPPLSFCIFWLLTSLESLDGLPMSEIFFALFWNSIFNCLRFHLMSLDSTTHRIYPRTP